MGVASAGSAYQQALAQGHSQEGARTYSLLVGAAEGGLQYMLGGVKPLGGTASEQVLKKISSLDNALLRVSLNGAVKIGSEVTEEEIQLLLEPVLRSLILKEDFSAPTFEDAAYTAVLTALTTAPLNAGSSYTNTNTRPTTTTETDYTPYLEQLKQAQRNKKVRDLQDAYQKFLESEQSMQIVQMKDNSKRIEKSVQEPYNNFKTTDAPMREVAGAGENPIHKK